MVHQYIDEQIKFETLFLVSLKKHYISPGHIPEKVPLFMQSEPLTILHLKVGLTIGIVQTTNTILILIICFQ